MYVGGLENYKGAVFVVPKADDPSAVQSYDDVMLMGGCAQGVYHDRLTEAIQKGKALALPQVLVDAIARMTREVGAPNIHLTRRAARILGEHFHVLQRTVGITEGVSYLTDPHYNEIQVLLLPWLNSLKQQNLIS